MIYFIYLFRSIVIIMFHMDVYDFFFLFLYINSSIVINKKKEVI